MLQKGSAGQPDLVVELRSLDDAQLQALADRVSGSGYGRYLQQLLFAWRP